MLCIRSGLKLCVQLSVSFLATHASASSQKGDALGRVEAVEVGRYDALRRDED